MGLEKDASLESISNGVFGSSKECVAHLCMYTINQDGPYLPSPIDVWRRTRGTRVDVKGADGSWRHLDFTFALGSARCAVEVPGKRSG